MKYKLKSIKFWFTAFVLVNATIMAYAGILTGAYWFSTVTLTAGGYFYANLKSKEFRKEASNESEK